MYPKIPNHPSPKSTCIAFVLVYEDYTISYNEFGQRLGCYPAEQNREQKFYCTFFTKDRVIISLKSEKTLFLHHNMSEDRIIDENRTDLYFESPIYQHASFDASHVLYFHFAPYMKPYFDLIQGMEPLLAECELKEKYHHEFFLELYAVFKVLGLTCWKPILVERIMNRVQEEMISDLHHYLSKSTFETVNDIIYDELIGMPIFGGVQKLSEI